jgi:hypothetical protein
MRTGYQSVQKAWQAWHLSGNGTQASRQMMASPGDDWKKGFSIRCRNRRRRNRNMGAGRRCSPGIALDRPGTASCQQQPAKDHAAAGQAGGRDARCNSSAARPSVPDLARSSKWVPRPDCPERGRRGRHCHRAGSSLSQLLPRLHLPRRRLSDADDLEF